MNTSQPERVTAPARRRFVRAAALLAATAAATPGRARPAVEADTGAQRIISLAPHLTELLFAAGAGERIVGVSAWSDYPPAARSLPRIGDSHAFDLERIVALRPDLVVGWQEGNAPRHIAQLRRLGLRIVLEQARGLDDIADAIERLGELAGTAPVARQAAADYRARLAALRARHAGLTPVRVFHQVWDDPLMTVNGHHPVSDLIVACGGVNVFADAPSLAPVVSREAVLRAQPAVITAAAGEAGADPFAAWRRWPNLPAVARGLLVALPADAISRLSPRLLDAAPPLAAAIAAARTGSRTVPATATP